MQIEWATIGFLVGFPVAVLLASWRIHELDQQIAQKDRKIVALEELEHEIKRRAAQSKAEAVSLAERERKLFRERQTARAEICAAVKALVKIADTTLGEFS